MAKYIVEKPFWELFPEVKIGIVVCRGIDNHKNPEKSYYKMLRAAEDESEQYFVESEFAKNPVVAVWREAYRKFKTKKGARCSIEALLKRIEKGDQIGNINPLVDIYNSISLKYGMPCGGQDISKYVGDVRLTVADGGEDFITYGSGGKNEPPYPGEIVYKDDAGAICRCWTWRECERTILTEDTTDVALEIELVDPTREEEHKKALEELGQTIVEHLGGIYEVVVLTKDNPEFEF